MMQNRVVQHGDARLFERALVDFAMQLVVAEMVEVDIAIARHFHVAPD